MIVKASLNIVENREIREKTNILEGSRDTGLIDFDDGFSGQFLAVKANRAVVRTIDPGQQIEDGCLPRAVRPYQSRKFIFL